MPPVTDQLRIGIIGVNGIGQAHLWSLRQSERSCAAAVCDIDEPRAEKAGADFDVPAFADLGAMLASGTVDAVVVATPAGTHGQIARDALDAGMHVYCEKPIAPTADEGYALARHAHEAQRTLQVGFQFRFHKGYAATRWPRQQSRRSRASTSTRRTGSARSATSTPARGVRRGRWPVAACS